MNVIKKFHYFYKYEEEVSDRYTSESAGLMVPDRQLVKVPD
jgi:hypothetical protein